MSVHQRDLGGAPRARLLGRHPVGEVRSVLTHQQAAARLVDAPGMTKTEYLNRKHRLSYFRVHPEIIEFHRKFTRALEQRKYPLVAFEMYRNEARQGRLYRAGGSIYEPGQSPHNFGMAVDYTHITRGTDLTRPEWNIIGALGKETARRANLRLVWGGDSSTLWDPAHWQLADWRSRLEALPDPVA